MKINTRIIEENPLEDEEPFLKHEGTALNLEEKTRNIEEVTLKDEEQILNHEGTVRKLEGRTRNIEEASLKNEEPILKHEGIVLKNCIGLGNLITPPLLSPPRRGEEKTSKLRSDFRGLCFKKLAAFETGLLSPCRGEQEWG